MGKALRGIGVGWVLALATYASQARASEPRKVGEPFFLREPTEITDVVDAFDDGDPFDLHLSLGFQQTWKSADIQRETHISQDDFSSGGYTASTLNAAKYSESTTRLNTRADVGLYKDIAFIVRMPIILSNTRELEGVEGSDDAQSVILEGAPGEQLFNLPFRSPTRSGVEYLALGFDFGIFNQWRDPTKPNMLFGFEGRFNVSEPMHPCNESPAAGQVECALTNDIDRDGVGDEFVVDEGGGPIQLDGTRNGRNDAGVSRGTTALELHSYVSKRIKYIEPYGGISTLFEFQNSSSEFGKTDFEGSLVNHPPFEGSMLVGVAVIPWEEWDQFRRLAFDFRFTGSYRSEGRDYSELFDALGSSDARSLRDPNFASFEQNPDFVPGTSPASVPRSVANTNSEKVYTTGITDVQQHGKYKFQTSVSIQAGKYVKFALGGAVTFTQGHLLTFDQACNPDFKSDVFESGPCQNSSPVIDSSGSATGETNFRATGIPNPNYRAVIDTPGRRFEVDSATTIDAWVNATVMF